MPPGFHWIIVVQFLSALADNALLIVTMAILAANGLPVWWAPLLKLGFTLSYVVLAPVAGALADAVPKGRLMGWMNAIKGLGCLLLLVDVHPVLAFALVGLGASAYAPAKYGLITELVPSHQLVKANGWIEVSVVCAALLGAGLGGYLVSSHWLDGGLSQSWQRLMMDWDLPALATQPLGLSVASLVFLYSVAGVLNVWVPASHARYPASAIHPLVLCRDFWRANLCLWRDPEGGRLSLSVTTLFWGVGATLQFIVLQWAQDRLGLSLSQAAYLQAVVAIGVVAGAVIAGRYIPLHCARNMLFAGVVLGLMIVLMAQVGTWHLAVILLLLAGVFGGLMIVPLNALLQHRGYVLLSAGRSVAVQGFNENASVLVMVGLYAALTGADWPVRHIMWALGGAIAVVIGYLWWCDVRAHRAPRAIV